MNSRLSTALCFAALSCTNLGADECKLWDFKKPPDTAGLSIAAAADLLSWNGGTEAQCRRLQESLQASLKKRSDEASASAEAMRALLKQAREESSAAPADANKAKNLALQKKRAEAAESQETTTKSNYRNSILDLECTCKERGPTAVEQTLDKIRQEQEAGRQQRAAQLKQDEDRRRALKEKQDAVLKAEQLARQHAEAAKTADAAQAANKEVQQAAERRAKIEEEMRQQPAPETARERGTSEPAQAPNAITAAGQARGTQASPLPPSPDAACPDVAGATCGDGQSSSATILAGNLDPFSGVSPQLVRAVGGRLDTLDAFPSGPPKAPEKAEDRESERAKDLVKETADKAVERSVEVLTANIKQAEQTLAGNPARLRVYKQAASDNLLLLKGLSGALQYGGYAVKATDALMAGAETERNKTLGELAVDIANDITSKGITEYVKEVFGERWAAALGNTAWVALEVLRPEQISADPEEIVRDTRGNYSIKQRREALAMLWKDFGRDGNKHTPAELGQLLEFTALVSREVNAK